MIKTAVAMAAVLNFKNMNIDYIGKIHTDFPDKFGLPRQSGVVKSVKGVITFYPPYNQPEAFKGLEGFDYIWILFHFDRAVRPGFNATVKPPRLGGNVSMGVFATRSPFRPNNIGLTCGKIEKIIIGENGPEIHVSGVDMADNTPVIDIKPYLPYADAYPDAKGGFTDNVSIDIKDVIIPDEYLEMIPENKVTCLKEVLMQDPRPGYKREDNQVYGMFFLNMNVRFKYEENIIKVIDVTRT